MNKVERDLIALDDKTSNTKMIREEIQQGKTRLIVKPSEYIRNSSSAVWHVNAVDVKSTTLLCGRTFKFKFYSVRHHFRKRQEPMRQMLATH